MYHYLVSYYRAMEKLEHWVRGIDDCTLWDQEFGDHFYLVVEFLVVTSSHGITQNPIKFLFGKEVEFIEFQIREDGIPLCAATVEVH